MELSDLSGRRREAAMLIVDGMGSGHIAQRLDMSEKSAAQLVQGLYHDTGASDRASFLAWYQRSVWTRDLGSIRAYIATEGDSEVPLDFVDADGEPLGRTVAALRRAHATGDRIYGDSVDWVSDLDETHGWTWESTEAPDR